MHTLDQLQSGQLAGIRRLQLRCALTDFPREIFSLADSLEILDLTGNALSSLPDELPRLSKLRIIFCSENQFTELPKVLGACPQLSMIGFKANQIHTVDGAALPPLLRWLVLTDNQITELPPELGQRPLLQKLMLAGNRLRTLPRELANCQRLELLRIAANELTQLPTWLLDLPRLAWLAFAGNPFCVDVARPPCPPINWQRLQLQHRLGEGASGVIHQATMRNGDDEHPVAVKLFKSAITSDGLPDAEMAACISAGAHPNLIPVLGVVEGHPAKAQGLVLSLIDPAFRTLAGPPSLDSCTRDIYADDQRFDLPTLLTLAHGIAAATAHLHAQGILHGDLYGHNILHCGQGNALLGDFGAASRFAAGSPLAEPLQRLEVRAFGCLLEELAERCDTPVAQVAALTAACLGPATAWPLMAVVAQEVVKLRKAVLDK